ncbi:putative Zn-finger protein [Rhizoctonia solani 123E]|uniref:Putative Zn-finger protein n=1 Tax=Rhizoctonia solani 123E TaxID=1423351 RepID=A0A074RH43_9AGAM|nr:putative Zn-finger protein [Rhizoctonia solani 123E]
MWDTQVSLEDKNATVVQYMVAMDQTPLTGFCGNKKAHPVYFTIGNLPKAIRRTHSHRAVVLLGYLPVPDLDCEPNATKARDIRWKLFNDCLRDMLKPLTDAEREGVEIVCADGNVRRIYPVLSASIADFPEQCKNACVIGSSCPLCLVHKDKKGDLHPDIPLRQKDATLQAIADHRKKGSANFIDFGLHDQWPWWSRHTYLDIGTMHTPDLLHQLHKGVFKDHLMSWLEGILGSATMDSRYQAMPEYHTVRHFKKGVTKLSRTTGREAKEMMKVILPVACDASPQVIEASRALLKFMYLAHSSTLTETELCEMDRNLSKFHQCKGAFVKWLKTDRGYHNIAKIHALQHYTHTIRMLGTPDGYNTELPERLHIDLTKAGFRASNKVDGTELEQMTNYIQQIEALAMHRAHLDFLARPVDFDDESDTESNIGDDGDYAQGCVVQRVIDDHPTAKIQGNGTNQRTLSPPAVGIDLQVYYPSPEILTSKQRTECVTVEYLITAHCMPNLRENIATFFEALDRPHPAIAVHSDTKLDIWTSARLFHQSLPFKPLEPLKIDKIRAYPAKVDSFQRVRRVSHFDTVLVLAYPEKQGIHRYRAARVRAIFELPKRLRHHYPHKLVYVDWFNPFGPSPLQYLGTYSTALSLDQAQKPRSSVLPLAAIQLTCHFGPKFNTIDKDVQLTRNTDIFSVCKLFNVNPFGSYYTFELMEHWERTVS